MIINLQSWNIEIYFDRISKLRNFIYPPVCALVILLHIKKMDTNLADSVLPVVINISQLLLFMLIKVYPHKALSTFTRSHHIISVRSAEKPCSWHTDRSGCVNGLSRHPSFDRHSCTGDTWRVSPLNGAWCDAVDFPSEWTRHHTGCTGKDVPLRTQEKA